LDLVEEYETVLREYDRILDLSEKILTEIKEGMPEETLITLLEEKQKIADNINRLAQRIAQTDISERPPVPRTGKINTAQTLAQIKSLLEQIRSRAESLLKTEEEIRKVLEEKNNSETGF
jgi:flagellar biosynthesis/type III secretory pathway chaperone